MSAVQAANTDNAAAPTLYAQLGGEAAVDAAVDRFYAKVLADARVKDFFEGVDMVRQSAMQKEFLTFAFGGPVTYSGQDMRSAHAHLVEEKGLSDMHFDAIVEHLGATLREMGVEENLIAQVAAVAESVREPVLNR
ncbi:group I truncated hemoglobin [Geoalkalibacter halelectricus]|uniref:group I truncated hemoglobin n=1 Tax=Geoalkalibacter halelectricus TaxID=2847045 RepID=UPI0034613A6A